MELIQLYQESRDAPQWHLGGGTGTKEGWRSGRHEIYYGRSGFIGREGE